MPGGASEWKRVSALRGRGARWAVAAIAVALLLVVAGVWQLGARGNDIAQSEGLSTAQSEETSPAAPSEPAASDAPASTRPPAAPGDLSAPSQPRQPGTPPSAPRPGAATPAPSGSELERVSDPPPGTVWALSSDSYAEGASLTVRFQPYGYGPDSFGPSVAVAVTSATPSKSGSEVPDLTGGNAVFLLGQTTVRTGGRYEGVVTTELRDDRIFLVLQEARPIE